MAKSRKAQIAIESNTAACQRCGEGIKSFSPMRKWCFDCRKRVTVEQAKARKQSSR